MLGIPDQALNVLHMTIEPILANGTVLDRGRAMLLLAKCQVASVASCSIQEKAEGKYLKFYGFTLYITICNNIYKQK